LKGIPGQRQLFELVRPHARVRPLAGGH
jgi:hypothetical protein